MAQPQRGQRGECFLRVPGLLGPVPVDAVELVQESPPLERLAWLLSRARRTSGENGVAEVPGFALDTDVDPVPAGPLGLLGAGGAPGEGFWFRADPVHLLPDRDQLRLLGPETLALDADESAQLVAAINDYFRDDGLELVAPAPNAWFLYCAAPPRVQTVPLDEARHVPLGAVQPRGADASWWQARLNEMQMLLHGHAVNQERERQGRLMVNGVWPWGGGVLPAVRGRWDSVFSDDPFTRGLALAAGIPVETWPAEAEFVLRQAERGATLAVAPTLPAVRDGESFQAWEAGVEAFSRAWTDPLEAALRQRRCAAVTVDSGGERPPWRLSPASMRAFWRRRRRFVSLLVTA